MGCGPKVPDAEEALQAFHLHLDERAHRIRERHGPAFDRAALDRMFADETAVRFPTELRFDLTGLEPGEFAHAERRGELLTEGFVLFVHPDLEQDAEATAQAVAYHLPSIDYPGLAGPEEAERFGAQLLGLDREEYYQRLCVLADRLWPLPDSPPASSGCGSGNCGCSSR